MIFPYRMKNCTIPPIRHMAMTLHTKFQLHKNNVRSFKRRRLAILFRVDAIEPITMSFYPEKEYYFEDIEIPRETSDEYQEREYMEVVNEDTISAYIDYTTSSCMVYGTCLGVYHE